jgi:23S rRNA (adenine2030-N6)-methyltransferase
VSTPSRYRPDAPPDYSHRFHAGNVGDVWKHCALVELLRRVASSARRVAYVDTHAGDGRYPLGPTGEWREGIGRLWTAAGAADPAVDRYLALCRRLCAGVERPEAYPGSPLLARAVLGPSAAMTLWERDPPTFERLVAALGGDPHAETLCDDGLRALPDAIRRAEARADAVVVLVDSPWGQKTDWTIVPDALAASLPGAAATSLLLWYPVKSLTRPNAMIARLEAARVAGAIAELVTTPLDERRNRLNGSGVLLVHPPAGTLDALAAAATALGTRCATHPGTWSVRVSSWTGRPAR